MERRYDLIIIGAGPAGMSAAIYGSRAGLKTAMLEMGAPGGKLIKTAEISNWPGIIETNGAKLASDMFEHSTSFGAEYLYGNVQYVTALSSATRRLWLSAEVTLHWRKQII